MRCRTNASMTPIADDRMGTAPPTGLEMDLLAEDLCRIALSMRVTHSHSGPAEVCTSRARNFCRNDCWRRFRRSWASENASGAGHERISVRRHGIS